jgi:hypothetical protein
MGLSCFTPIVHSVVFLLTLCSSKRRKSAWKTLGHLCTPLTNEQTNSLRKAKREAKESFQPRRVAVGKGVFRVAEQGESGGARYSLKTTTLADLGEFGLGVSGYFVHLSWLIRICLFMTAISIPSMMYFESDTYRKPGADSVPFYLFGSGVCTSVVDVMVRDKAGLESLEPRNECPYTRTLGVLSLTSILGVALFVLAFKYMLKQTITSIDESQQTAQHYTVQVHDPVRSCTHSNTFTHTHVHTHFYTHYTTQDADASDPDEWYKYFSQYGEVASVTIALDNGALLRALAKRRKIKMMLQVRGEARIHTALSRTHAPHTLSRSCCSTSCQRA